MKHLKPKQEFNIVLPDVNILDSFSTPTKEIHVRLKASEVTSLCPVTGQPDYHGITVDYIARDKCLESKSFKLYLTGFRNYGIFTEALCSRIWIDLTTALNPVKLTVHVSSTSRGGISISAERRV